MDFTKENDNEKSPHQGEVLMILVKRSKMDREDVAQRLGIRPNYLSDCYRRPMLSSKIKAAASILFEVDESIFDDGIGYLIPDQNDVLEEPGEMERLQDEVNRLHAEKKRLEDALLREQGINDDLRKTLLLVAGKNSNA